jgi:hypothetical protein
MQIQKEFFKYSLPSLLSEYSKNRELIRAHLKGESVEGYTGTPTKTILGLSVGVFVFLVIIHLILFIWSLFVLGAMWPDLPVGIAVMSVISIFAIPFGSIIALILMYSSKWSSEFE